MQSFFTWYMVFKHKQQDNAVAESMNFGQYVQDA